MNSAVNSHDQLRALIAAGRKHDDAMTGQRWMVGARPHRLISEEHHVADVDSPDDLAGITWMRTHLAPLLDALEHLVERVPICAHCEQRPAACFGCYEGAEASPAAACDECCRHGNEDGWCVPIADLPGWASTLQLNVDAVADERDRLRAEVARLEAGGAVVLASSDTSAPSAQAPERPDGLTAEPPPRYAAALPGTELFARLLEERRHASEAHQLAALRFAARFHRGGRSVGPELMHLETTALQVADTQRALQATPAVNEGPAPEPAPPPTPQPTTKPTRGAQ